VLVFSLIVMGIVMLVQILLMILLLRSGLPGWLFSGTAIFTVILMLPLLIGSVIHPAISMTGDGLILQPLIGHAQFVRWEDLTGTAPHPLIFNDEATGRLLYGKRYRPREGLIVLVAATAGLSPLYRLVGGIAGASLSAAFGISSTTHENYDVLVEQIRQHSGQS